VRGGNPVKQNIAFYSEIFYKIYICNNVRTTLMKTKNACLLTAGILASAVVMAGDVGSVDTETNLIGPNHKINVSSFPDPKIQGVTCFISRPVTGGLSGAFGVAEEKSDASIACRQTGPIKFTQPISGSQKGEEVFSESRSILFKGLHVQRFYEAASNTLIYLTYSKKLIAGSPKNSISAVTPQPWGNDAPEAPKLAK
jgi:CreA protein